MESPINCANPVYGVATICRQVRWLRWGHPSLFHTVGRMVRYYFALAYKMVKMSKSAFLLKMEVSQNENLS